MGNPYNSIYDDIDDWSATTTYLKNYIAYDSHAAGAEYFYVISDSILSSTKPHNDSTNWGGVINFNGKRMPNFIWTPSYNQQTKIEPRVLSVRFGGGYEQRTQDGINNDLLTLSITFEKRNSLETTAINHFLNQRKGAEAFVFTPPAPFATAAKFICNSFNTNYVFFDNYTVTATFQQVP